MLLLCGPAVRLAPGVVVRQQPGSKRRRLPGLAVRPGAIRQARAEAGLSLAQVAYVGDDVNDLPTLHAVGCPCTVADAMSANRACALYITSLPGGHGAVREICDLLVQLHAPS